MDSEFQISNYKVFVKGSLRAFFTITLPSQLVIHNCSLFEKNGARWVSLPSQKFTSVSGTTSYKPICEILDRTAADEFRELTLAAIDRMNGGAK
jgi:DNA-binding cell septation regulator SpoVG